jgi:hypothetical protein
MSQDPRAVIETRLTTLEMLENELTSALLHLGQARSLAMQAGFQAKEVEGNCLHSTQMAKLADECHTRLTKDLQTIRPHIKRLRNRLQSKLTKFPTKPVP